MSRLLRFLRYVFMLLLVVTSTVAMTLVFFLHGSLPKLDGTLIVPGLRAKVEIERDSQGIPTLRANHREDIAYGLGFLHAQERFFQMDLYRRKAAGEAAELLGSGALIADRTARRHNFRSVAQGALAETSMNQRRTLDAYTLGVNQGLAQLRQPPLEYLFLGETPEPWRAEDSILVLLHQHQLLYGDPTVDLLNQHYLDTELPADWRNLFAGSAITSPNMPLSALLEETAPAVTNVLTEPRPTGHQWALSRDLTTTESALLATDLHLPNALPNHWYRAQWRLLGASRLVSGITLPGTPMLFMGSNGDLAWTLAPTADHGARLKPLEVEGNQYRTPQGWRPFRERQERINVQGSTTQELVVRDTHWGPVVGRDSSGQWLALHWDAQEPAGINLNLLTLETATTVAEALTDQAFGTPAQHLFVADREGEIGWSQIGVRPRENSVPEPGLARALDDSLPLFPVSGPRLLDQTRLWRVDAGPIQASAEANGPSGWEASTTGALPVDAATMATTDWRAEQLRIALHAQTRFSAQDMRDLQLATDAHRLQPWVAHLSARLPPITSENTEAGAADNVRFSAILAAPEALPEASGNRAYALAQAYRNALNARTLGPLLQSVQIRQRQFQPAQVNAGLEGPLWRLIQQANDRHLPPAFASWSDLFDDAAEAASAELVAQPQARTLADLNPAVFNHPLSDRLPGLDRFLNWLEASVTGDAPALQVQYSGQRAAMGLVVSPGAETDAQLYLAGSQSNHPFSPYFWRFHNDWSGQEPSPLLPDITRYQMTLLPQR